jgi:hypothetical protein
MANYKGQFLWYELLTSDVESAKAFYGELMGWKTAPFSATDHNYHMWMIKDRPVGGLMKLPEEAANMGAPPHWMGYVGTTDVDATTKQAERLGAKILIPPTDVPKVGRWSLVQDPQGAILAPYRPIEVPDASTEPTLGEVSWHELATTDINKGWNFYQSLFDWQATQTMDMGDMGPYKIFMASKFQGGGMFNKPASMQMPSHWLYYFKVANIEQSLKRCESMGGKVVNGPNEVPGGDVVAQCLDPQQAAFALHVTKSK